MPVANIIDERTRKYCSFRITAMIEPACMSNDLPDSDQYDENDDRISTCFEERPDTSVYLAINWANTFDFPISLYLFDFHGTDDVECELIALLNDIAEQPYAYASA